MLIKPSTILPIGILSNTQVIKVFATLLFIALATLEYGKSQTALAVEEQQLNLTTAQWLQQLLSTVQKPLVQTTPTAVLAEQILLTLPDKLDAQQVKIYQQDGTFFQSGHGNPAQNYLMTEDDTDHGALPLSASSAAYWHYYFRPVIKSASTVWPSLDIKNLYLMVMIRKADNTPLLIAVSVPKQRLLTASGIKHQQWAQLVTKPQSGAHWKVEQRWTLPLISLILFLLMIWFWLWFRYRRSEYFLPTRTDFESLQRTITCELNIMLFQTNHESKVLWVHGKPLANLSFLNIQPGDSVLERLKEYPKYMQHWRHSLQGEKLTYEVANEGICLQVHQWPVITERKVLKGINVLIQDISEQLQTNWQLKQKNLYDPITALPNRQFATEHLLHAIQSVDRRGAKLAVLIIELTDLDLATNQVNQDISISLLKRIINEWQHYLDGQHLLCRISHDEFLLVISDYKDPKELKTQAETLTEIANKSRPIEAHELSARTSIGITTYPQDAADVGSLIANAVIAKGHARQIGHNQISYYSEENARQAVEKWQLEKRLAKAISSQDFRLHYQPIFELKNSQCIAAEALARWPSSNLSPDQFIPLAEESGLIHPIGLWVIESALHDFFDWKKNGLGIQYISVNLSTEQLKDDSFFEKLDEILSKYPFSEGEFLLELTESIMIQNSPSMIQNLARLRERGIQLAIDDLGTGFSSLSYLKHFPVKTLKIDRSFIPDTLDNREDMAICETIIQLAQSLNLDLIAEGIETTEQMEWLITKGVHHAQGFFFAKPVDAETFQNYLILK